MKALDDALDKVTRDREAADGISRADPRTSGCSTSATWTPPRPDGSPASATHQAIDASLSKGTAAPRLARRQAQKPRPRPLSLSTLRPAQGARRPEPKSLDELLAELDALTA